MSIEVVKVTEEERAKLLTPVQIADRLGVSERTVRRWLRQGKLRGIRAGRQWLVSPASLETFLHGGDRLTLTLKIDAGIGALSLENGQTGKFAILPDYIWEDLSGIIEKQGMTDAADMIRRALRKFQAYRASVTHLMEARKNGETNDE